MRKKIKGIRQDFSKAVVKGSRSGSGKIVYEHWDTLISIWGGSPSTQSLQFGVESHDFSVLANLESMDNINLTDSDSDLVPESHCSPVNPSSSELSEPHTNSSNVSEITCGTGSEESTSSGRSGKRKTSPCPALIDQKRKHLEKKLSAAQRDRVLLETTKEEAVMRREMLQAFTESSKRSESAMNEIANSMNNFSQGFLQVFQTMARTTAPPQPINNPTMYPGFYPYPTAGNMFQAQQQVSPETILHNLNEHQDFSQTRH